MPPARTVVMALQFPPRGGSAQVVRYLAPEITANGWAVSLVAGSVGGPGELGFAPEFFAPLPVTPVDYTPAMGTWALGGDPLAGSPPCTRRSRIAAGHRTGCSRPWTMRLSSGRWRPGPRP